MLLVSSFRCVATEFVFHDCLASLVQKQNVKVSHKSAVRTKLNSLTLWSPNSFQLGYQQVQINFLNLIMYGFI
jgi:hypothetical protein